MQGCKKCITAPSHSASASASAISSHHCAKRFCIDLGVGKQSVVRHCECGQNSLCYDAHVPTGQRTLPAIPNALSLPTSTCRSDSKPARMHHCCSTASSSTSVSMQSKNGAPKNGSARNGSEAIRKHPRNSSAKKRHDLRAVARAAVEMIKQALMKRNSVIDST